jgi:hypothetical protein
MKSFLRKHLWVSAILGVSVGIGSLGIAADVIPAQPEDLLAVVADGPIDSVRPQEFVNAGTSSEIELAMSQIPVLFTKDTGLSRFSREQISDPNWVSITLEGEEIRSDVKKIWTPNMVENRVGEVRAGIELVASETDPAYFTENEFSVTRWMGIEVMQSVGRAVFEGRHSYFADGKWFRDKVMLWEIEFEVVDGGSSQNILLSKMTGFRNGY